MQLTKFTTGYQCVEWSLPDGSIGSIGNPTTLEKLKTLPSEIKVEVFESTNTILEHSPAVASGVGNGYSGRYMKVPAVRAKLTAMGRTLIVDIYQPCSFKIKGQAESDFHF